MEKITLTKVKSLIKRGSKETIRLVPSKMSPVGMWGLWHDCNLEGMTQENFNKILNSFSYYNCNNETGLRVHYYIVK